MHIHTSQLTLHKLEVFCAVAELESISRAAERMNIAQPVVTAHVHALQEKLGVALTEKRGRTIALTPEGQRTYAWAKDVIVRTRELEREFVERPASVQGAVAIAASLTAGSYVLPAHLARFRAQNRQVDISLKVATPQICVDAVRAGECDFAVTILDAVQSTDGLDARQLWAEAMVLVAAPGSGHVGTAVDPGHLAGLPFIAAERGTPRRDIEEAALRAYGIVRQNIELEIGQAEGMKEAVLCDAGVAFLFQSSVARELAREELRLVHTPGLSIAVPVFLVMRRGKSFSPVQTMLLDYLSKALSAPPVAPGN